MISHSSWQDRAGRSTHHYLSTILDKKKKVILILITRKQLQPNCRMFYKTASLNSSKMSMSLKPSPNDRLDWRELQPNQMSELWMNSSSKQQQQQKTTIKANTGTIGAMWIWTITYGNVRFLMLYNGAVTTESQFL